MPHIKNCKEVLTKFKPYPHRKYQFSEEKIDDVLQK